MREDLHISENASAWELCSGIKYQILMKGSIDIYKELKDKYQILKYSGDTDGAVPYIGT